MVLAPVVVESGYVGRIEGGGVFLYHLGWCVLVYRIVLLFTCLGLSKDNVVHNKVLTRL